MLYYQPLYSHPTVKELKASFQLNERMDIQAILVPQGAEYQAVCRGLSRIRSTIPVFAIPVGAKPLTQYLEKLQQTEPLLTHQPSKVLLVGLCGSLTPARSVGDIVVYQSCVKSSDAVTDEFSSLECDRTLTSQLYQHLKPNAALVKGLTSDRIISSATEKLSIGQKYDTEVVDMEGFAALKVLASTGVAVAMVRVISDDANHNIPNLTSALAADGSLQPLPLAISMIQQPVAATRLIRGSLKGLQVLREVIKSLFGDR